jgi:aspartate racemase
MLHTAQAMEAAATAVSKQAVLGIPCNTFHAPAIFDRFLKLLNENDIDVEVLNMLQETAQYIKAHYPDVKKIGVMSTTGTRSVKVYNEILEPLGFEIIEVPEELQPELHDSVYNQEWGVKAKYPVTHTARSNFLKYVEILKQQGAEVIVLGCTEIPIALPENQIDDTPLLDPMNILARALIRASARNKLLPLVNTES